MKILFDQGAPVPWRRYLPVLNAAELEGYNLPITTDQSLRYQQPLSGRTIAILALKSANWPRIHQRVDAIRESIQSLSEGG